MALNLQDKQAIVAEVSEVAKGALSAVVADSRGVTVDKMTELRKAGREAGVYMRVVRNTLLRRVVEGTQFECLKDTFVGPTLIAYSMEHPGAAARLFKEFAKANAKFEVKAAAFEGELIPASQIDRLATLPTYEEAIARLMATMKEASAGKLVRTLAAVRDAKEAAGVYMRVVRNTLLRRVVEGTQFECLKDTFVGPTLIAYSMEHPGAAARLFKEFAKANAKFEVKAAAFEGELIPASQIDRLATLPTYEEAIARLMATMKEASAGKLVRTLAAVRDAKEAA
ncbi:50S ribosomal protein L10 [Klebsiella pneumoniae]|nr:50S ribosomal protein L10 [Klebsiella pneumoniae]RMA26356.1 50S ribosomal protein L10 [Klebsiella pneumoniae]